MEYHIVIPKGQYNCPECGSDRLGSFCHGCNELICGCRPSRRCPQEEEQERDRQEREFHEHQREEQEAFEERQAKERERFEGGRW